MKKMTSPVNKNKKRIRVVNQLLQDLKLGKDSKGIDLTDEQINQKKKELEIISSRIVPEEAAKSRRTKKYRGAKA